MRWLTIVATWLCLTQVRIFFVAVGPNSRCGYHVKVFKEGQDLIDVGKNELYSQNLSAVGTAGDNQ